MSEPTHDAATLERAERLRKARSEAAIELRRPETDLRVRRFALLACEHDDLTARYLAGEPVDIDGLTKLEAAMQEIKATLPPEPISVSVEIVKPTDTAPPDAAAVDGLIECRRCHWRPFDNDRVSRCYKCGLRNGGDDAAPWSSPLADAALPAPENVSTATPSPAKPVHPNDLPRVHPGSIHDQPGVPLKRYDEPWRVYGRTS